MSNIAPRKGESSKPEALPANQCPGHASPRRGPSTSSFEALPDTNDPQLNQLASKRFNKTSEWITGELNSTSEDKNLLVQMNRLTTTTKYSDMRQIASSVGEEGEHPGKLYSIPVFQRKDGTTLRVGHLVQRSTKQVFHDDGSKEEEEGVVTRVHVIHGIMITSDLGSATLSLYPVTKNNWVFYQSCL